MPAPIEPGGIALPPACREIVARVDEQLRAFVAAQRREMTDRDPSAEPLFAELERVILAGGKRLRPLFCCLGHMAAGAEVGSEAIRAAAGLELLHTFAIVHDDVMDRSPTRRGAPSSWKHLADEHRRTGYPGDPDAYGDAAAVLAGDMALVLADRALLDSGFPQDRLAPALRRYDRMRVEVIAGQYLDVLAAHRGSASEEEARRIAVLKSGGYTVEAPVQIGAILGEAEDGLLQLLSRYGVALGEAFQLRDDVLGVFGDPEVTGKPAGDDLREGKRTVLIAHALAGAGPEKSALIETELGNPALTEQTVERMRAAITDSGAVDAVEADIARLAASARMALKSTRSLTTEAVDVLDRLIDTATARSA